MQNGYTAQCSVGVTTSIISLAVSPTSKTLNVGETVQLTGTKNPSTASEGTQWTSSNTSVATVSNSGLVTAKSAGTATITFKNSASTKSASCTVKVLNENYYIVTGTEYNSGCLAKLDNAGNILWQKNNIYGEQVTTAFATSDSGVIIGTGQDQMDLVGIIKYDKNGNKIWHLTDYSIGSNKINSIFQTSDGSFIIGTGRKKTEEDRSNGRFIKIDSNGKILWTKQDFSGNRVLSVTQISSGDYIIGTTSSVTKHNSLGNKLSEISIGKKVNAVIATKDGGFAIGTDSTFELYNSQCKNIWKKEIMGNYSKIPVKAIVQTDDNCFIIGTTQGVIKYDKNGNQLWKTETTSDSYVSSSKPPINSIVQTQDGGYLLGAGDNYQFNSTGKRLIKLDANGKELWRKISTTSINTIVREK